MSPSYGHTYLTSYGWTGTGTGLRKGSIAKPLAIPPKKNLSGLGKDRDEAFPFWDHLFTAASKAITIKVTSDDEDIDETEVPHTDPESIAFRRTTTGIISNRRPVTGTPASTSGNTTPSLSTDADITNIADTDRLSLLAAAKREAAKRGLYARFFRGPVLGPGDNSPTDMTRSAPSSSETSSISALVPEHIGDREDTVVGEFKNKKRKLEERAETKEERREHKGLKKERKAARAAKRAEKALAAKNAQEKKDRADQKTRKHRDEESGTDPHPKQARKRSQKSAAGSGCDNHTSHRPLGSVDVTDASNVVSTKKKKGKRKDNPS